MEAISSDKEEKSHTTRSPSPTLVREKQAELPKKDKANEMLKKRAAARGKRRGGTRSPGLAGGGEGSGQGQNLSFYPAPRRELDLTI